MASPNDLVVVTAAAGWQCSHLVPLLYGQYRLRLVVMSDGSKSTLSQRYPEAEVLIADMSEYSQCKRIVRGATVIYHVGPTFHPHEKEMGYNMINAAEHEVKSGAGKLEHFVYSSVLNTQFRKLMNHDCKRYVEEHLYETRLNYTVLKPSDFLDMAVPIKHLVASKPKDTSDGRVDGGDDDGITWHVSWNPDVASSLTALGDLAEVAAKVIVEREVHFRAEYPLCSTPPLSRRQIGKDMEKVLGKRVKVEQQTSEDAVNFLTAYSAEGSDLERGRDAAERLMMFYNRRGLVGNTNVMKWLLGREPTSHIAYMKQQLQGSRE